MALLDERPQLLGRHAVRGDRHVQLNVARPSADACAVGLGHTEHAARIGAAARTQLESRELDAGGCGAHRNPHSMAVRLKAVLVKQLDELGAIPTRDLLEQRYKRLRGYGAYQE